MNNKEYISLKNDKVINTIKDIVHNTVNCTIDSNSIYNEETPFKDYGFDSLGVIHFIMDVEDAFEIDIDEDTADYFKTPKDVIKHLYRMIGANRIPEELI